MIHVSTALKFIVEAAVAGDRTFRFNMRRPTQHRQRRSAVFLWMACATAGTQVALGSTTHGASAASSSHPISMSSGNSLSKIVARRWNKAASWVEHEQQYVEDYNANVIAQASSPGQAVRHRRLICLPLDERFDPPMGMFSHRHVQSGDKMSLPSCFLKAIHLNHAEVPWLFSVSRVEGVTGPRVEFAMDQPDATDDEKDVITECKPLRDLDQVVGGPLDFRAPNNYVFLPLWMMRALGLRPRDIVQVEQITTVEKGALAKFRPHSAQFAKDISDPRSVLETELRHYSALTQGSTIAFDYNKKRYWLDVVELRSSPRNLKVDMIKVQDCDIATDFLVSKDELYARRKKKRQQQLERQE
jgi:Ubiquitin fusion degradation protein UFD1